MGRIKTKLIKRTVKRLMEENPGQFSDKFDNNKKKILEFANIPSKKIRNVVAGYLVRLTKKNK
jgi:small subunit ribosomal protein S17e